MDIAKLIKDLRESTGMSRKEFSEHTKGKLERYNIFHAFMLVRHSNDGKL